MMMKILLHEILHELILEDSLLKLMMLTNWVKDHIDELDKDVEDLRQALWRKKLKAR